MNEIELEKLSTPELIEHLERASCTDSEFAAAQKLRELENDISMAVFYLVICQAQLQKYSGNENIIDPDTQHQITHRILDDFIGSYLD